MALGFDNATVQTWTSGNQSFSHTVTGADRYIFITAQDDRDMTVNDGDVSYNSVNVPLVATYDDGGARPTMRVFGLKAPATGSNTVAITVTDDPKNQANSMVASYTGVDQTTPIGTFSTATGATTPATVNVGSTTSGNWVVDFMCEEDPDSDPTAGAGQTERIAIGATGDEMQAGISDEVSSGGTVTMSWAVLDLATWITGAVELVEITGGLQEIAVGQAFEVDTAQAITVIIDLVSVGQATETDLAKPIHLFGFGDITKFAYIGFKNATVITNLGSNPTAGNLLLLAISSQTGSDQLTVEPGDGFVLLTMVNPSSAAEWRWYWKISDGTEASAQVTWLSTLFEHAQLYAEYEWDDLGPPTISTNENETEINGFVNSLGTGAVTPDTSNNIVIAFHGSNEGQRHFTGQAIDGSWTEDIGFADNDDAGIKFSSLVNVTGSQEATHSDSDSGGAMYGAIAAFSVSPFADVGQVVETDLARTVTVTAGDQSISVTQVIETDTAQAITLIFDQFISIGQVVETDLAQAITVVSPITIAVGQATEVDTAQAITVVAAITIAVTQVIETDLAQAITIVSPVTIAVGQVIEVDLAQAITVVSPVTISVGQATEIDLAQAVTVQGAISITVGQVIEVDLAQTITPDTGQLIAIGQVVETDLAQAITVVAVITISVGQVVETDLAQAITVFQGIVISVGQAVETDLAQAITVVSPITIAITQVIETDLAQAITVVSPITIVITQVVETDLAQAITVQSPITIALGQVIETDLAQTITAVPGIRTITVTQVIETDTAQAITVVSVVAITITQATEIDTAQAIDVIEGTFTVTVVQVIETDLAQAISLVQGDIVALDQAFEVDIAQTITSIKGVFVVTVDQAFEIDLARSISLAGAAVTVRRKLMLGGLGKMMH